LLTEDVSLGSVIQTYLNRPNYFPERVSTGARWLTEWIAAETSVVELFALVLRANDNTTGLDEYSALQREVVHSRVARQVLGLLSTMIGPDTGPGMTANDLRTTHRDRLGFGQFVCETQQFYLTQCLTSALVAVLGDSVAMDDANAIASIALSKSSQLARSVLTLFGATTDDQSETPQYGDKMPSLHAGVHLIISTLSWALRRIVRVEENDACNWDLSTENLRQAVNSIFSCPAALLNSPSESSVLGIDAHQREVIHLQNLISVGLALLRVQLRSLVTICEQTAYIAWRLLDYYLNQLENEDDMTSTSTVPFSSPRGPSTVRRLQDSAPLTRSPFLPTSTPRTAPIGTPVGGGLQRNKTKREVAALREHLPRLLDADLLETMTRLSKSSYLESNQRLFVQVMQHRLGRLISRPVAVPAS
uniref:Protoglobin domain-containing protein n=1 Tax=Echinostoma caproni TaxID=27848 RepID=A0A183ATZ5_9TREM